MSGIKRTAADHWFSKCVRIRANWTCEKCGAVHAENSTGLHCSHHHSRRNWSIRLEPLASEALCYGCHSHYGGTEERRAEVFTKAELALLTELKNDIDRGREYKRAPMRELSSHYRREFERMQELRAQGETGRIEFVGYL